MTSNLSDAEIAARLREMGQDVGPVNVATRGVYQRKLERLLLEQSSLYSFAEPESPLKELHQNEAPDGVIAQNPEFSVDTTPETEGNFELDEICDGSLRIEGDEGEEGFTDEERIGCHELHRNEPRIKGLRRLEDVTSACEWKFQKNTKEVYTAEISNDLPSSFDAALAGTERAASQDKKVLHDDKGGRKESCGNRHKAYGSFSPAPLAKPAARNNITDEEETGHLRLRTAPLGQEMSHGAGSHGRGTINPVEYIPSPRSPLSTYLERCTPPPSSAPPQSIRPTSQQIQPARVQPRNRKQHDFSFWIIVAIVFSIGLLVLLVFYNMEPGYKNPV